MCAGGETEETLSSRTLQRGVPKEVVVQHGDPNPSKSADVPVPRARTALSEQRGEDKHPGEDDEQRSENQPNPLESSG